MFALCTTSSQGQCITTGPTDLCKTPTPGGPVPMPYPNIGTTSNGSGSSKVKVLGKEALRKGDKLSMSTGDEPGCAGGGAKSSRFKGNVVLKQGASKVKVQGKAWAHHAVMTEQNNGNIVGVQCVPCQ